MGIWQALEGPGVEEGVGGIAALRPGGTRVRPAWRWGEKLRDDSYGDIHVQAVVRTSR